MKYHIIQRTIGLLFAVTMSACTDWAEVPIPSDQLDVGTYLRTLEVTTNFDYFDLENASFQLMAEAVVPNNGRNVAYVDVLARIKRDTTFTPEVLVARILRSDFQPHSIILPSVHLPSGSPYPAATIDLPLTRILNSMGLRLNDIEGGDVFLFRIELTTTEGRVFTTTNASPELRSSSFHRSPFEYAVSVICASSLQGTYELFTLGWCAQIFRGRVRFVLYDPTMAATQYSVLVELDGRFVEDYSFGLYRVCYGASYSPAGGEFWAEAG